MSIETTLISNVKLTKKESDLAQGAAPLASALVKSVYLDMMVYSVQVDTRDTIKVTVSNRLMR